MELVKLQEWVKQEKLKLVVISGRVIGACSIS
nr:hypothetical protein [Vibrio cholerae]